MSRWRTRRLAWTTAVLGLVAGCASQPPIEPVPRVDLERFMGDWYVIASTPTPMDREAFNAVESYTLSPEGHIDTVYRFRQGGFNATVETLTPTGFVEPGTGNAVWGMQFVWPIKAEYVIAYLSPDHSETIIARSKRDYAWIMARTPTLPEDRYAALLRKVVEMGYDPSTLRRVPQRWPESGTTPVP
ncbi:lipocalin family protein [Lysobacter sp. SG-8]|uniref:Outer membrane lipoprotein Blc n=1 Tax=Marilutibacter penaei TaxID=2759900 RepID=A0A7W3YER3_9GAMM|nr:lipocalin family protein [Lysobacter penaei]MBB1088412.1 lipocalin family protein [Lysobacter penaei]